MLISIICTNVNISSLIENEVKLKNMVAAGNNLNITIFLICVTIHLELISM